MSMGMRTSEPLKRCAHWPEWLTFRRRWVASGEPAEGKTKESLVDGPRPLRRTGCTVSPMAVEMVS